MEQGEAGGETGEGGGGEEGIGAERGGFVLAGRLDGADEIVAGCQDGGQGEEQGTAFGTAQ